VTSGVGSDGSQIHIKSPIGHKVRRQTHEALGGVATTENVRNPRTGSPVLGGNRATEGEKV
jgi:hypothetical protein